MPSSIFNRVIDSVQNTYQTLDCTGAALVVFHNNELQVEQYWGQHSYKKDARHIQSDTKFHIASCRKSYIAFAVAYAINQGFIQSLDDEILTYLPLSQQNQLFKGTTICHLVTHSHGLAESNREVVREFPAGSRWAYRGINVDLISEIIKYSTKKTIADILNDEIFKPLNFTETNWYNTFDDSFVDVIRKDNDKYWSASSNLDGSKMNMYASARELAQWGLLHLNNGIINGKPMIDSNIIKLATTIQNSPYSDVDLPDNGILWFVKGSQAKHSEIGEHVPNGAFQILGYTTVTLLVIPMENIVAVRAFNSFGNPQGYDYLKDVRAFGDAIMLDLNNKDSDL